MKEAAIQVHFDHGNGGKLVAIILMQDKRLIRLSPAQGRSLAKSIMVKLRGAH